MLMCFLVLLGLVIIVDLFDVVVAVVVGVGVVRIFAGVVLGRE